MATLVLTAVGAAVGGPIGAAVGAIAGQQIDARLFAPKARHGPRLGELAVQTSSYGSAIPKIFGTMRVAGTVIWATDLREQRSSSGGGKGRPRTVDYSYSASFAVALSGRPIRGIGRIWADGKLLKGAGGDFKNETGYRLYLGDEEQPVDPLIAAAEGAGQAPAYRGIAYAVFEDFQLADYGNRLPSLSFEIEADAGAVPIGSIAQTLSGGLIVAGVTPTLRGYAATGDSVRGAIETLANFVPMSLIDEGSRLRITTARSSSPQQLGEAETGARGAGAGGKSEIARRAAAGVAGEVSITYHDPARDFQTGLQRASRSDLSSMSRVDRHALPAALDAEAAKGLAEYRLAALWAGRATAKLHLGWRHAVVRPGAHALIERQSGVWKVERWALDRMVVSLELVRVQDGSLPSAADASPGRSVAEPDLPHGPTTVRLLDLPLYGELAADRPQLLVAAAGVEAGWRRAALLASYDGGGSWQEAGPTAAPAVIGTALSVLAPAGSALLDLKSSIGVELLHDGMWLESRSDAALVDGANLASLGGELIQFGVAEALGARRFRLSRLLRGRRGTDWASISHAPGEDFFLIERAALAPLEPPAAMLGGEARVLALGIGDGGTGVIATRIIDGDAMRPPSPAHLRARLSGGDIDITWVRRSRAGWPWLSGSDTPLGEELERYELTLSGTGFERSVSVDAPSYVYTAAQQLEDGHAGSLTIAVVQLGTQLPSRPATLVL